MYSCSERRIRKISTITNFNENLSICICSTTFVQKKKKNAFVYGSS